MGDRTHVVLTIPTATLSLCEEIIEGWYHHSDIPSRQLSEFAYDEVNWGVLSFLPQLQELGIPYDSHWDAGSEYSAGITYLRFTDTGEAIEKALYDEDEGIRLSDIAYIRTDIKDPVHRALAYDAVVEREEQRVYILPWDNQVEYGKKYRTKQLLNIK